MRMDDPFGFAGGAGSVDDESRLIAPRIGRGDGCWTNSPASECEWNFAARRFAGTNDMLEQTTAAKFAHRTAARCFGEDQLRSGLLEYRGQLDCGEQRVDQNGNDAELHRSEKRGSELRRVTHLEENEIAAF